MATPTVENYVKQLYLEQQRHPGEQVLLGRLATALDVVPGTVTTMIRTLDEAGLVDYEPRVGVRLTHEGERLALHVLRRHRIVEAFLVKVLGFDWSEVHDEAEELEHVISDKVLERMDELLGRPAVDPHGDPIPDAQGRIAETEARPLSSFNSGDQVTIQRVESRDPEFLRYLESSKLTPGATLKVERHDAQAGTVTLTLAAGTPLSLSTTAANRLFASAVE